MPGSDGPRMLTSPAMSPRPKPPTRKDRLRRLVRDLRDAPAWHAAGRSDLLRVAIVTMGSSSTCLEQFAPLARHRRRIRDELRTVFRTAWVDPASGRVPSWVGAAAACLVQVNHFIEVQRGMRLLDDLSRTCPAATLLYYDGDDDAGVAWPEVAGRCALVVKNQLYRDRSWYTREFIGKCNLTDHVARVHGISFADDPYPRSRPLPHAALERLWLGWNLGCSSTVRRFVSTDAPAGQRLHDVILRADVPTGWVAPLRRPAVEALERLSSRLRVILPDRRVDHATYRAEMLASRICLSPFGNGEVCHRDFEAVLAGCLLVKPDMSHLETRPDVFRAGETCATVRWDWSDLEQVVERHLADPVATERIVRAARRELEHHLSGDGVVANFGEQLRRVGLRQGN